ncbi:hypothetical protein A3860_13955 [Niastella vici]|uniref:Uncharacterized protein n=1 Tax=Niastella vici TaxID=1703345 RepID=A0A1V9G7N0_9BACT|nr:hypothetical protein [Niastella vici]OQP66580.1 hypothetical protein A3860_13955 [Niastella vici]
MKKFKSEITGHLDIFVTENEDELNGEKMRWKEILIHGDPDGLKSFAKLLIKIADLNQDNVDELPIGAREHIHLRPKFDLSNSSEMVIVGRLDAKGNGVFYDRYISKDNC